MRFFSAKCSTPLIVTALFLAVCWGQAPASAQSFMASVSSENSRIHYFGSAFLHDWRGTSGSVDGRLFINPSDPSRSMVELTAPLASFDSGNKRRDRNMREVTSASTFPTVRFRSVSIEVISWEQEPDGMSGTWSVTGELLFHGETQLVRTNVDVRVAPDTVFATTRFPISLEAFGISRPELLWVLPIKDEMEIDAKVAAPITDSQMLAHGLTTSPTPNGQVVKSSGMRPIFASAYDGNGAGLTASYKEIESGNDQWAITLHGVTDPDEQSEEEALSNTLADGHQMRLDVDGDFMQPLRVTSEREPLANGQVAETRTGYFTESFFKRIAEAQSVVVTVGAARFALPYSMRHDLRLLLNEAGDDRSETASQR